MLVFSVLILLLWLPLMLWWLILPQYFPFFADKKFGRFSLFGINLVAWIVAVLNFGKLASVSDNVIGLSDMIGVLAGFIVVIWLVVRGIRIARKRKQDIPILPKSDSQQQSNTDSKSELPKSKPKDKSCDTDQAATSIELTVGRAVTKSYVSQKPVKTETQDKPKDAIKLKPVPKQDIELGDTDYIQMTYQGSDGKISTRDILVRSLKLNKNGDWFMSAVDVQAKKVKSFRVDNIISLSHNGQTWTNYHDILGVVRTFETLI